MSTEIPRFDDVARAATVGRATFSAVRMLVYLVLGVVAVIYIGADSMSRAINIPTYIADVIVATSVLSVLVSLLFVKFRVRFGG